MHELIYKLFDSEMSKVTKKFYSRKLNHYYNQCDDLHKKLKERLDKEGIAILNEYYDNIPEIVYEEKCHAFLCGMQTGARLMMEMLDKDE